MLMNHVLRGLRNSCHILGVQHPIIGDLQERKGIYGCVYGEPSTPPTPLQTPIYACAFQKDHLPWSQLLGHHVAASHASPHLPLQHPFLLQLGNGRELKRNEPASRI